jgi:hypothetical protein
MIWYIRNLGKYQFISDDKYEIVVIEPVIGNRRSKMSVKFLLEQFILNEQSDVDLHLAVLVISGIGL